MVQKLKEKGNKSFEVRLGNFTKKTQTTSADNVIGGSDPTKFVPNLNISKWDDEAWININHEETIITNELHEFKNNKVKINAGKISHEICAFTENDIEWVVTWDEKPQKNEVRFKIDYANDLVFHPQPELSQWEIENSCTRDPHVIGGISVKKKEGVGFGKYGTGQLVFFYRWHAIDANGDERISEHLRIQGNKLIIEFDQDWLDNAVYPVKATGWNPNTPGGSETMGEDDTSGVSWTSGPYGDRQVYGEEGYSPSGDGSATAVSLYARNNDGVDFTMGIWNASATLLADTGGGDFGADTEAWYEQSLDSSLSIESSVTYYFLHNADNTREFAYQVNSNVTRWNQTTYSSGTLTGWLGQGSSMGTLTPLCIVTYDLDSGVSFSANIQAATTTPTAAMNVTRALTADVQAQTNTPNAALIINRPLTSDIQGQTTTPSLTLAVTRGLTADVQGQSITPGITLPVSRLLTADIQAQITTSAIALLNLIAYSATIAGQSTTSTPALAILRALIADITGASTSSTINLDVEAEGIVSFVASILAATTTSAPAFSVIRKLTADIQAQTTTPAIDLAILRSLTAAIEVATTTSTPFLLNLVAFTAGIQAQTITTQVAISILRQITTQVEAGTATSEASLNVLRQFTAAMDTSTLTSAIDLITMALGVILNPSITSLTLLRSIGSLTTTRTMESLTTTRTIHQI